jgi:hypothetical protein
MTVEATRLMRVTGDCFFFAERGAERFTADFLRGAAFDALRVAGLFDLALDFDLVFAFVVPREAARFDAVDDFRALPPDDFDAVAMIVFLVEGTGRQCARFAHRMRGEVRRVAESTSHCGLQSHEDLQHLPVDFKAGAEKAGEPRRVEARRMGHRSVDERRERRGIRPTRCESR